MLERRASDRLGAVTASTAGTFVEGTPRVEGTTTTSSAAGTTTAGTTGGAKNSKIDWAKFDTPSAASYIDEEEMVCVILVTRDWP